MGSVTLARIWWDGVKVVIYLLWGSIFSWNETGLVRLKGHEGTWCWSLYEMVFDSTTLFQWAQQHVNMLLVAWMLYVHHCVQLYCSFGVSDVYFYRRSSGPPISMFKPSKYVQLWIARSHHAVTDLGKCRQEKEMDVLPGQTGYLKMHVTFFVLLCDEFNLICYMFFIFAII